MSLNGEYDSSNIFAKIIRGEIPCAKVYEDEHILAFMDAFPQSSGHCLVIPKAPSRNLLDATGKTLGRLIGRTQKIAAAVNEAMSPDGIIITQFNGAPAGQTVFHLHFHIIPRYTNGALGAHASGEMADMDELQQQAAKIIAALEQ
ncbi:MAG: HIT family protein [Alphaproteobacteria bacterium]